MLCALYTGGNVHCIQEVSVHCIQERLSAVALSIVWCMLEEWCSCNAPQCNNLRIHYCK